MIVGPTASGKSDLAVEAIETLPQPHPEIINCDSIQFFEAVEIGSAKPPPEALAKVPHHLIGHLPKGASYTAGDFRRDAINVIEERTQAGITRFVGVGGSGFYMQALEKGMFDVPQSSQDLRGELEAQADREGLEILHAELLRRDPVAGTRIQAADRYRIIRALEILRGDSEGRTLSEIQASFEKLRPKAPFEVVKVGLKRSRDVLREAVHQRTRRMLAAGFVNEVKALREEGLKDWSPLQSVGYKEVQAFLDGTLAEQELESAIVTSTMQLAKRQMTWFKRDPLIEWFDADNEWARALARVRELLESHKR